MSSVVQEIQESAVRFANTIVSQLNKAVAETAGVEVMWFRATPDKRSQDVIFQSYTLYGVDDCPITFKAMYSDSNYNDAAITYNIMGLSYAIPMTLDISTEIWKEATGDDGTIPQQHDIVYIPISRKLLEVISMEPVKTIAAQLTSYKVNLEVYKPTRSRLVGENLKESITETTTNLKERFGDDIDENIKNIVDDNQLSLYTSTSQDKQKEVKVDKSEDSGMFDVRIIKNEKLIVDGHNVALSYYSLESTSGTAVTYKKGDTFTSSDERCYSSWFKIKGNPYGNAALKNIRTEVTYTTDGSYGYLHLSIGNKFKTGTNVVFKRGKMIVPGYISDTNTIRINLEIAKSLAVISSTWYTLPGFALVEDNVVNLLNGGTFSIDIKANTYISFSYGSLEKLILISDELKNEYWYGIILNIGDKLEVDLYSGDGKLEKIFESHTVTNSVLSNVTVENYSLMNSYVDITNIRLYDTENTDVDKQITDLVTYNVKNDSHCIINDSADVYLNKPYVGRQR